MPTVNIFGARLILKTLRAPRFKKPYTVAIPPPWSKLRSYLAGRSVHQESVNNAFKAAAVATARMALADRMWLIGEAMRGVSFGGVKRVVYSRVSPEARRAKLGEVKSAVAAAARIVA